MGKGNVIVDGKCMGPDYGRYFYSKRGTLWAVTFCDYDYEGTKTFEKIETFRTKEEAMSRAFMLNMEDKKHD